MKVFFLTEGTRVSPASRIRVFEYLDRFLDRRSIQAEVVSFTSGGYCRRLVAGESIGVGRKLLEKLHQFCALWRLVAGSLSCEVVFIQRVLLPVALQKLVHLLNKRLVYDFDDAVYLGSETRRQRFAGQVALAARIIAVSRVARDEAVARGAPEDKVVVLPSAVDTRAYRGGNRKRQESFTVGWIGSPATTCFLEAIWPQLARFGEKFPQVRYLFIGARPFDTGSLNSRTEFRPWSPEAEKELLSRLDVGLMPLEDDPWCRGKGGYKLIQYMAAGCACVASAVGANLEIVQEGQTGFLIRRDGEWESVLSKLLADRELCRRLGTAGRQRAEELYDCSVTAPAFFAVLEEAAKL